MYVSFYIYDDVYDDNNMVCVHDDEEQDDDAKDTNDEVDNEGAIMQQVFPSQE